jgi:hypothetical protein
MEISMNTASQKTTDTHNFIDDIPYRQMVLPNIPDAIYDEDHDGLLPLGMLNKPLRVEFAGWPGIAPDHSYQLLWNGALIGEIKMTTTEKPLDPLFLDVPVEYLVEGVYAVAYRAINTENGVHADSATVRLEIVLTPPGLPKLAPMKFPDEIDCGLTSAELTSLGDQLVAEIGSYAGIYQHDVIRTFWGDMEGPGAVVSKTATGLNRIHVTYTRDFLQSLGNFDGFVTYSVEDRAGNISEPSLGTHIRLLLNNVSECSKNLETDDKAASDRHSHNVVDITLHLHSSLSTQLK